jgi:cytochrome bd-type quinol oxidase subunit 2
MKNHFVLMLIFSICTSLVLSFIAKRSGKERMKYFLTLLCAFIGISILASWLMFPFPF